MKVCAAEGCDKGIPRHMLMCKPHWFMVPKGIRDRIWQLHRDRDYGESYDDAVEAAVAVVESKEAE